MGKSHAFFVWTKMLTKGQEALLSKKDKNAPLTETDIEKLRQDDADYVAAGQDAVSFMAGKRQLVYNIARRYHLETEELFQECYEVLLTCLRDFNPLVEKKDGETITVKFSTFFAKRVEGCAMEMRSSDPEYQARKAFISGMSDDEKEGFRNDPPILVQHLDQGGAMQEFLTVEASEAREESSGDLAYRIARDSFFEQKLNQLISEERDEKKKTILLHVKVGGVYNFQEMAYHFGVSDSRASQVMNELMDAFYVQRMISEDLESVVTEFVKMKLGDKRLKRLAIEAVVNAPKERGAKIVAILKKVFPQLEKSLEKELKTAQKEVIAPSRRSRKKTIVLRPYQEVLDEKENKIYPVTGVEMRPVAQLLLLDMPFRSPEREDLTEEFAQAYDPESGDNPVVINEKGVVIDGEKRVKIARQRGVENLLCIVRKVPGEQEQRILRVVINLRLMSPSKVDLFYAIEALAEIGLSQQKIAKYLDISRTNVIIYAKVRDKASPKMRALFEDELIQITNASTCVELSFEAQDQVADFIRRYGPRWSKGASFAELFEAASNEMVHQLAAQHKPIEGADDVPELPQVETTGYKPKKQLDQVQLQQVTFLEQALKDAEVWKAQRESVIAQQTDQLNTALQEIESLRRELDASELKGYGNQQVAEEELKDLRQFYNVAERITGAQFALTSAANYVRRMELRRQHQRELAHLVEQTEQALNKLRVELVNSDLRQPKRTSSS